MKHELSKSLLEWYWEHGCRRTDKYTLPLSGWVNELYEARDGFAAAPPLRPNAMHIIDHVFRERTKQGTKQGGRGWADAGAWMWIDCVGGHVGQGGRDDWMCMRRR